MRKLFILALALTSFTVFGKQGAFRPLLKKTIDVNQADTIAKQQKKTSTKAADSIRRIL